MPIVFRDGGLRYFFYSNEGLPREPRHVHVKGGGRDAKTPQEIMSAPNAQELRALLDYANRYHHETNAAYATELISDAELSDFTRRTLAFIRRP